MTQFSFADRLVGEHSEAKEKLAVLGLESLDELVSKVVPASIQRNGTIGVGEAVSEYQCLQELKETGAKNIQANNFMGQGFYGTVMPSVVQRNILENPSWYTSYTPYQAEISQGRLEALLNYQTMIIEMTGLPVANASLLDEASATAEAMLMLFKARKRDAVKRGANKIFVDEKIFKQNLDVLQTKAEPLGIEVEVGRYKSARITDQYFAVIVQYPNAEGTVCDYTSFVKDVSVKGLGVIVIADILALALLTPPGEWGADAVVGSVQRFGLPMGFGGPHAAFFAAKEEYLRKVPGRIIGISEDAEGNRALRMALQTREQHIKRERATSNICTAQALLANMAGMYAVYHGKEGIVSIAKNVHCLAAAFASAVKNLGFEVISGAFFDTVSIAITEESVARLKELCLEYKINLFYAKDSVRISFDETKTEADVSELLEVFAALSGKEAEEQFIAVNEIQIDSTFLRESDFLTSEVFKKYRTEHELMRYIKRLERKDISLTDSMISLGSCTMKLNAATSMLPLSWGEFANIHPFVPAYQAEGYNEVIAQLGEYLCKITGFDAVTFQPNSGAAGEYTGLLVMKEYFKQKSNSSRTKVLIPASAHGTNPASAVIAGLSTITVACDEAGNIDIADLKSKAKINASELLGLMVTYPSTHGVYEDEILEVTKIIHDNGGLVYMDGANMNAQVGLTNPLTIGADVCHLNLHKTFGIPHGGGGPGVGPVLVKDFLKEYLPCHSCFCKDDTPVRAVAAAPYGNANVLLISYLYIKLLGDTGLKRATIHAILNANYIAEQLKGDYKILYTGKQGYVAHELIIDCREFKKSANIEVIDIAKRLIDFGYHAPTVSFPVPGTLMIEPAESESKEELDRFIEALKCIRNEIKSIEKGEFDAQNNLLKNAPHTIHVISNDSYNYPYSRTQAAFPLEWVSTNKYWAPVSRVNDALGDRNVMCSCN